MIMSIDVTSNFPKMSVDIARWDDTLKQVIRETVDATHLHVFEIQWRNTDIQGSPTSMCIGDDNFERLFSNWNASANETRHQSGTKLA